MIAALFDPGSYQSIGWILVSLFALVAGLNQVLRFYDRLKDKPAPADLKKAAAEKFVRREDCLRMHGQLEAQFALVGQQRADDAKDAVGSRKGIYEQIAMVRAEMVQMERRLNEDSETRQEKVHARVDEVLRAVSRVEGKLEAKAEG